MSAIITYLVKATDRSNGLLYLLTWWKKQITSFALPHFYCPGNLYSSTDGCKYWFCWCWKTQLRGWQPRAASWQKTWVCLPRISTMGPDHHEDEVHITLERHDYKFVSAALPERLFQLPPSVGFSHGFHAQKQKEQQRFSTFLQPQLI